MWLLFSNREGPWLSRRAPTLRSEGPSVTPQQRLQFKNDMVGGDVRDLCLRPCRASPCQPGQMALTWVDRWSGSVEGSFMCLCIEWL